MPKPVSFSNSSASEERIQWLDILRTIAITAVVLMHVSVPSISDITSFKDWGWNQALWLNAVSRFGVPVFLMITGVLFLNKKYNITSFLSKRGHRIILPFLLWSALYYIMYQPINPNSIQELIFGFLKILQTGAAFHLWYVYMILGIYLILPLVNIWIKQCTAKELAYFLVLWIVAISIHGFFLKDNLGMLFTQFYGYLGFVILGYALNFYPIIRSKKFAVLLMLIGIFSTYGLTLYYALTKGGLTSMFFEYLTPNVTLTCIGVFLVIRKTSVSYKYLSIIIQWISKYSYGVYLAHIAVLGYLQQANLLINTSWIGFSILLNTLIVLLLSTLLISIIHKIPLVGRYISG